MTKDHPDILYDTPDIEIYIPSHPDPQARREIRQALNRLYFAFEAAAIQHLPDVCRVDIRAYNGVTHRVVRGSDQCRPERLRDATRLCVR